MTKLLMPLQSIEAKGTFGKCLEYKTRRGVSMVRKKTRPGSVAPFSASMTQLDKRWMYKTILAHWQSKTTADKEIWNVAARSECPGISGWNAFLREALRDPYTYHGLVGYWSFNRIINNFTPDASNQGLDGEALPYPPGDQPILIESADKKLGRALEFDGTYGYVKIPYDYRMDITRDVTIEYWINSRYWGNLPDVVVRTYYNYAYGSWVTSTGKAAFTTNNWALIANTQMNINQWYYVCMTREGNLKRIYIDGRFDAEVSYSPDMATVSYPLTIAGNIYGLQGAVDEVRIYNRAISIDEVKSRVS